jgi:hypothetical protein
VLDFWQRPVADLGPTGPDQGNGGKYLVIAPGGDASRHTGSGRIVLQSATNNVLIGLRLLNPDPQAAAEFKAALAMSRLGEEPRPVRFIEGLDREWSATPPRGMAYWQSLARILEQEPVREVDKIMMAMLEPLGIVKGEPFEPDAWQARILTGAAALGELMMRNLQVPAPVPVAQFWGLTLYSENTRRPYDNGGTDLRDVNLDSRDETLQRNADGSTDLYIGPAAPPGLESNWMKTVDADGWFVYFRLYAPTEPFFDRSWALPDFELVTP